VSNLLDAIKNHRLYNHLGCRQSRPEIFRLKKRKII